MLIQRLRELVPFFVACILLIATWEAGVRIFSVPDYLLPAPRDIMSALWIGLSSGRLTPHIIATSTAVLGGYFLGTPLGLLAASLLSEYRLLERAFYPMLVGFQSIPKVALAPIVIVWFGFGIESKVVLVALMCFFPAFINGFSGLKSYNPDLEAMFRVFGASRAKIFFRVKLPSAARSIFAGLQIAIVMALLGTILSEMIAASKGLGYVIQSASLTFEMPLMFACTIILATMGIFLTKCVQWAQKKVVFWQ